MRKQIKTSPNSTSGTKVELRDAYQDGRCVFCGGHECNDKNPCKWREEMGDGLGEDSLLKALEHVEDIMDRIGIPHMLLGEVAEKVYKDQSLAGIKKIEVGIQEKYLIPEMISSLKTLAGDIKTPYGYGYNFDKIPVEIKIIRRHYHFFEHPELVIYRMQDYWLPNSMDTYLKARWIIR
jgi:hypothetical protein